MNQDLEDQGHVSFYGPMIHPDVIMRVVHFIHNNMTEIYDGIPIEYDQQVILMAPDITLRVWGTPGKAYAAVIELSSPVYRTLN